MYKTIIKIVVTLSLFISLLGGYIGQDSIHVEAATNNVLPDNHMIEQLNVKYYKDSKS
ncbi:hypothetical protein [Cytobacillus praedii]|uniref:hypothetical protein n=1 Tax=Cytobacillus praedii TaxID=1742358 RepID=UPI002E1BC017|nr:hypothetical protein [Cytobacillus praedii]